MLFWGNIVLNCLLLSVVEKLGEFDWFFRTSLVLALVTWWLVRRAPLPPEEPALAGKNSKDKANAWLIAGVFSTLGLLFLANLRIAYVYLPNNYDSLTYHLPRVMYYLGHNTLAQFETADIRQVYFSFNYNLLQLACFGYGAPFQSINFLNVASWVVTGFGVYRVSRLSGCSFNGSLIATWLTLTSTGVLAQATATTLDLPTIASLLASFVFALRWIQSRRTADAVLAGLAAGISAGAKLTVVFFGPAVVFLIVAFWYQHWRRGENRIFFAGVRAWITPALIAILLSIPFIIYNLVATGHWMTDKLDFTMNKPFSFMGFLQTSKAYLFQLFFEPTGRFTFDLDVIGQLNDWFSRTFFSNWNEAHAYSGFYVIPPDLNEDHVWYGFAGPFFLICGLICLWKDRRLNGPVAWFALLSIAWFITYFAMNKWSLYIQRYFLPAVVLLAPSVAVIWDRNKPDSRWVAALRRGCFFLVAVTALWFSFHYLAKNHNRPFSLPYSDFQPPQIFPKIPATLQQRLASYKDINIITEGTNERAFLLMMSGGNQRFTSSQQVAPKKYNVFSYWSFTRNNIYSNIAHIASHTIVRMPTKQTAGVEFLGTIGEGVHAFDYVGLAPNAGASTSSSENRNVVVIVHYGPTDPDRFIDCTLRVDGLNPRDNARIEIDAELMEGRSQRLMTQTSSGTVKFSLREPFKRLSIQIFDIQTGRRVAFGDLPFAVKPSEVDILAPVSANTLFRTELIATGTARGLLLNGLADVEGPYSQWELPMFRWAKQPAVRIELPRNPKLKRLKLSFDMRLQLREEGHLGVYHNGNLVRDVWLKGSKVWHSEAIDVVPSAEENVFELIDLPNDQEPDWLAYLDQYPDVKAAVASQQNQAPEAGAKSHYESHGRTEGRVITMKKRAGATMPDWAAYLKQNPDVQGYAASQIGVAPEESARWHYENHGKAENRPLPMRENPTPNAPPPDSLYYVYRSLQVEGFSTP